MSESNDTQVISVKTEAPMHDVHQRIGLLTRQLHDSLNGLGLTEQLKDSVEELPDAKSRLAYIARLTGDAAEKVLNSVDQAKCLHDEIAVETRRIAELIVKDPVGAVARGHVMNFVTHVEQSSRAIDQRLTEIMMAQDFHDLTGQVIARVVGLTTAIEEQLVNLLIETAPATTAKAAITTTARAERPHELSGPVVSPETSKDVVTNQSQVDDLLASLGF
jgi:chemotaxis protein CheZ